VPTLKGIETIHFEISGATGTGKSQTLKHLIKDIKSRGPPFSLSLRAISANNKRDAPFQIGSP
jgi:Cdc6-like AAA superfamily ATPase